MVRNEKGFTIIELVVVIVILGILAAVAFPKFQDLSTDAKTAVVSGAVAAVKSAAVITFARNSGVVVTFASVQAQVTADNVTFSGDCTAGVTVTYVGGGASSTIPSSAFSGYCAG